MELKPLACLGVNGNTAIEISQETLRSVLGQIESELLNSEVYSRALASLRTMLGEAASGAEILIKAVSREAIRLTYKGFARPNKTAARTSEASSVGTPSSPFPEVKPAQVNPTSHPTSLQARPTPPPPPLLPISILYQHLTKQDWSTSTLPKPELLPSPVERDNSEHRDRPSSPPPELPPPPPKKPKRLTKAQKEALAIQEREERLRQVGQELRKARQVRSLSLQQLHSQTLVPLHHLDALENGHLDRLPEDVYIRGFIRRLGNALGLDGQAMVASVPVPSSTQTPSWSMPEVESGGVNLRPVHLYLGYTALMAGAVGGVAWLSQQSMPGANAVPSKSLSPAPSVKPAKKHSTPTPKPGLKSSIGGIMVGSDIAPPEAIST